MNGAPCWAGDRAGSVPRCIAVMASSALSRVTREDVPRMTAVAGGSIERAAARATAGQVGEPGSLQVLGQEPHWVPERDIRSRRPGELPYHVLH